MEYIGTCKYCGGDIKSILRREAADSIAELLQRATEAENERDKLKAVLGSAKSLGADNEIKNREDKFINLQDALRT